MALDGTLKHWNNGEPTAPDDGLLEFKYWLNGEPYLMVEPAAPAGVAPTGVFYGPLVGPMGGPI